MPSYRCLAFALCLLALHAPVRAQVPSPGVGGFSFLGRTPDSGLTTASLIGISWTSWDGTHSCREFSMRRVSYADDNRLVCILPAESSIPDRLLIESKSSVGLPFEDLPGQYWLSSRVNAYLVAHSSRSDHRVNTDFAGHAAAWSTDGIMFRAQEDIRVIVEGQGAAELPPGASLWLERCDANGCTMLRDRKAPLPWIVTLPVNRLPQQQPDPNVKYDLTSEHYRISTSAFVEVNAEQTDLWFDGAGEWADA